MWVPVMDPFLSPLRRLLVRFILFSGKRSNVHHRRRAFLLSLGHLFWEFPHFVLCEASSFPMTLVIKNPHPHPRHSQEGALRILPRAVGPFAAKTQGEGEVLSLVVA